jgi:hypothetical protein
MIIRYEKLRTGADQTISKCKNNFLEEPQHNMEKLSAGGAKDVDS